MSILLRSLVLVSFCCLALAQTSTPLDDYVLADDGCFHVENLNVSYSGNGYLAHVWNYTSQCWLTSKNSNLVKWWHYLVVIIPSDLVYVDTALLYITGGGVFDPPPSHQDSDLQNIIRVATSSRIVAAVLYQVPNQPLTFPWDPWKIANRTEDSAIAPTWWHFMKNTSQPNVVLELPMTKAGVLAMDALELIIPYYNLKAPVDFIISGASKRGWTTWLVGAVDAVSKRRVRALIPIVLDALDLRSFFHRQFQFYGAWTFALIDYFNANITQSIDKEEFVTLLSFIDPFSFRLRLTMPKLVINAVGDEFQMPDDQRYWASDMPGETNLLMVKNAEHSLATNLPEALQGICSFVEAVVSNTSRPKYNWSINKTSGEIVVRTNSIPKTITVTFSTSASGISRGKRDFRWAAVNATPCTQKIFGGCLRMLPWATTGASKIDQFTFSALLPPKQGSWVAFILEMQWPNPSGPDDFYFTSPTSVIPNSFPFADCSGESCRGSLC